jgi:hypothetical protein
MINFTHIVYTTIQVFYSTLRTWDYGMLVRFNHQNVLLTFCRYLLYALTFCRGCRLYSMTS